MGIIKKSTYFKPSIHGWPFNNSWEGNEGLCGGMCWTALKRFFQAIPIKRDMAKPSTDDDLYDEIYRTQKNSVSINNFFRIYKWQCRPDLGHWNRGHSQGYMTQQQWPKVKNRIDSGKPVTITLIAHANDCNFADLVDSHRVVVYAYEIKDVNGEGPKRGKI